MNILYDHQIFTWQKYGGISRYFCELRNVFDSFNDVETSISLIVSNNYYISNLKSVQSFRFFPNKEFRGKQRLMAPLNKMATLRELKKQKYDLFHPTYYDPYFLDYIGDKPFVVTVHDMIHEKFQDMFLANDKTTANKKLVVDKASKVIAISESTKKDLIEIFGTDESKIEVVYHGNSMFPKPEVHINVDVPKKYILFVGSRGAYKNFTRFIRSVSLLLNDDEELSVVCVGGGKFKQDEAQLHAELDISRQVFQYDLDDDILAYFYQHAMLFVFPSLYEGFGIPVLEAFACRCPLVCSDSSSLPEIAGDGAYYFDPYNENSIREVIAQVLHDVDIRDRLVENGTKRLEYFSWERTALQTKKIYESVVS